MTKKDQWIVIIYHEEEKADSKIVQANSEDEARVEALKWIKSTIWGEKADFSVHQIS